MGGEAGRRAGEPTTTTRGTASPSAPTPGRSTLVRSVLACVDWGYYLDDAGKVSFYPATPTAYPGAVPQVLDATKRWDAIPGTTKANIVK
ncbi:MAG TPA: hypothetical protein VF488_08970 [Gemmatimonadaceae bacterium]